MLMDGVFYSVFVGEKPISYGCGNVFRIEATAGGIGQYGLGLAQSSPERMTKPPAWQKMYRCENAVCAVMSASASAETPLRVSQPLCCQNVSARCRAFAGLMGWHNAPKLTSKTNPMLNAILFIVIIVNFSF